jgi:Predicted membrane protein (DUF2207) C-terminal domain/Predicted membrane protein (DUF2207) N-terminal domain
MKTRLWLVGLLAGTALLWMAPARAQSGERIDSYDVNIAIERNGSILVVERIDYDFDGNSRHGIFRDIPNRLLYDKKYDRVFPIDVISVQSDAPDQFKLTNDNGQLHIRIGDPDRTITGRHSYTITYEVRGALNAFAEHDELYWNAIGNSWQVPIGTATAQVTAPADLTGTACFQGETGSTLQCEQARADGPTATFAQSSLQPYEGMTVVVGLPKGVVPEPRPILKERWSFVRAFSVTPTTASVAGALLVVLVVAIGQAMWRTGRDRRVVGSPIDVAFVTKGAPEQAVPLMERTITPVEYSPPEDIRPGQLGTLKDEVANPLDVTATIVDLAVRGYLRIEEIPKEGWFGKPDWRLVKIKEPDTELLVYERMLLDALFEDADPEGIQDVEEAGPERVPDVEPSPSEERAPLRPDVALPEVKLSSLKQHFVSRLHRVQKSLYADAVKRGWFTERPDKVRTRWRLRAILLLGAGVGLTVLLAARTHLGLIAIPVILAGLVLLAGANDMPRRTAKGTGLVRRVRGFRTYIDTAEAQEARFQERENIFSKYLPYAIVFGLTEKWARAFAALAEEMPQTSWYVGTRPFAFTTFASSIDHFTVSSAGTIASTPGGSGGSGFGGGSGGGGGGGGGGSW